MKTVMAFGSFDGVHPGHHFYLMEAKKLGNRLIVVVARDENIKRFKGKTPINPEQQRLQEVKAMGIADEVLLGNPADIFSIVKERKPDILALGYDQKPSDEEVLHNVSMPPFHPSIKRVPPFRPEIYKSSKMKRNISDCAGLWSHLRDQQVRDMGGSILKLRRQTSKSLERPLKKQQKHIPQP